MKKKKNATIYDVAREAEVSTATVSRLLNDVGPIREETRQHIWKVIEKVGYVPKTRSGQTHSYPVPIAASTFPITFLKVGDFLRTDLSPVTQTLIEELKRQTKEFSLPFHVVEIPKINTATPIRDIVGDAKGVLLRTSNIHEVTRESVDWLDGIPAVQVLGENKGGRLWVDHCTPDSVQIGTMAAEYLIEKECSKLVFFAAGSLSKVTVDRCNAFILTAQEEGKEVSVYFHSKTHNRKELEKMFSSLSSENLITGESRQKIVQKIAEDHSGKRFGIFTPSDGLLAMTLSQLQVLGLDIDHDVLAVGCNREPRCFSELETMPATMDLNLETLAEHALRRLLYRIKHPDNPHVRLSISPECVPPERLLDSAGERDAGVQ